MSICSQHQFFFFQAEDGIRDLYVTGVQTCALPIYALDAVLLLAHVALRHGDGVGVLCAGAQQRWVAPRKGLAHHRQLMNAVYDLRTTDHATDYLALATRSEEHTSELQSRRDLVCRL